MKPASLSKATLVLFIALIVTVIGWRLASDPSLDRMAWTLGLTLPLWLPLRGVIKGQRKTYAWATLCVIPYFILGITEAIANPQRRGWAGICLGLSLALFVTLILYLRITREAASSATHAAS